VNRHLRLGASVADALAAGQPVVALESTIISHGMPHPRNVATALAVEDAVRQAGAIPATIAVIDGVLRAGLEESEIELLGQLGPRIVKVSRRDLPFVVRSGGAGATTVAATMIVAAMAGIEVFATGGIGGVHRGAGQTFDISADLEEVARTNVLVVCAGVKSILDLGLTLEYLETRGVPVVGYGTDTLPAFYTRASRFSLPYRLDTPDEVAALMRTRSELGLTGGIIVANPIPEAHSMDPDLIEVAIEEALADATASGVEGKDTTPFLLARIVELTGSASLEANVELVLNNARVAAAVAVASRS
jgi:pseudouridylate synthase